MMATALMSMDTISDLLSVSMLTKEKEGLRDITADANRRFFPSIPKGEKVVQKHACSVGKQGSGKTFQMNYMAWNAIQTYGRDNVNIVYTDDPKVFLDSYDDRMVQLGIIDDATSFASSREIHKQTDILKAYNRSRHVYEERNPGQPGLVLYIFGWQRWIELDPGFRDGHLLMFKTGMTGRSDRRDIVDKLGERYTRILDRIGDMIDTGRDDVKNLSVARIASKRPEDGGVGLYMTKNVEWVLPDIIRSETYFGADCDTAADILEKYRRDPKWALRIECYDMSLDGGRTQSQIAAELSRRHGKNVRQGYVSESIQKVKGLLKK